MSSISNPAVRDQTRTVEYYNDFIWDGITAIAPAGSGASVNQGFSSINDAGGNPGWLAMQTGTTTTGRAGFPNGTGSQVLLGHGVWVLEALISLSALSDATDTYTVFFGFNDSTAGTGTDAVMFRYTHGANSGKFEAVTRSNGTETATDTGITVAATTNYKLRIEVNAAASSALFVINGSLVATNTTNIPSGSGRAVGMYMGIVKSAGTTSRALMADYLYTRCDLTVAR